MDVTYEVSVACVFEADSPEDAVRQMVAWVSEQAHMAGYRWERFNPGATGFIDAEDLFMVGEQEDA
jgi:hypothetical protein